MKFRPIGFSRKAVAIISLLFAAGFAPQSRATVFITSDLTVTTSLNLSATPPGPNLIVIEGSGPCGISGCESLDLSFTIKNISANPIELNFAGGAPSFVSGDPLDRFAGAFFSNDCGASLVAGNSCTAVLHYLTNAADFNGDSGLNRSEFVIGDNLETANVSMFYQITIVDPATPLPAALPLFVTGIGGLGLLGWRRKRKAVAVA
jgi:hypothetical protein